MGAGLEGKAGPVGVYPDEEDSDAEHGQSGGTHGQVVVTETGIFYAVPVSLMGSVVHEVDPEVVALLVGIIGAGTGLETAHLSKMTLLLCQQYRTKHIVALSACSIKLPVLYRIIGDPHGQAFHGL